MAASEVDPVQFVRRNAVRTGKELQAIDGTWASLLTKAAYHAGKGKKAPAGAAAVALCAAVWADMEARKGFRSEAVREALILGAVVAAVGEHAEALVWCDRALMVCGDGAAGVLQALVAAAAGEDDGEYGDALWSRAALGDVSVPWLLGGERVHEGVSEFCGREPFIVRGAVLDWPAVDRWAHPGYFTRRFGGRTVPLELPGGAEATATMDEFVGEYLLAGRVAYCAQHDLFRQIPQLRADFSTPPPHCPASECRSNAWFGSAGTVTPLHFDSDHNLLVQVVGYKHIVLFPADQTPFLYRSTVDQGNLSRVDVRAVDEAAFPEYARARGVEAVLGPGDMIHIPGGCWHYVASLTPSFSVSFWW